MYVLNFVFVFKDEPRIFQSPETIRKDGTVELICEVNNSNNIGNQINWFKDGKLLNDKGESVEHLRKDTKHYIKHYTQNFVENHFYKVLNLNTNGKLVSKLVIKKLRSDHKGVYKCKCDDGAEAKYILEFEHTKGMSTIQLNTMKFIKFKKLFFLRPFNECI